MAYLRPFLRLVAIGDMPGGETWTWSMAFGSEGQLKPAPTEVPQGVLNAIETFHTSTDTSLGNAVTLTAIKLNMIDTNGRYQNPHNTVEYIYETPPVGQGTVQLPPQCATAVTLLTPNRRGLASRGRFYVPRLGKPVGNDGRLSEINRSALLTSASAMVASLNEALGPDFRLSVTSNRRTGAQAWVNELAVGRVVDTIRSRRKGLVEDYLTAPVDIYDPE